MRTINYMHGPFDITTFATVSSKARTQQDMDIMSLRGDLTKQNVSFAIDSYPFDERFKDDQDFCEKSSDLKELLDGCLGRIILRKMTEEEQHQMREFREQQKSSRFTSSPVLRIKSFRRLTLNLLPGLFRMH